MEQVESLCTVLGDETRVCDALAGVLRDELRSVVELRPDAILSCALERLALQGELEQLTGRRRALVRDLAGRFGGDRAAGSVTALLPLLPPDPRSKVRTRVHALRRALLETRSLERQNDLLIGASLDHVGETIRALAPLVPSARYDGGARLAAPASVEQVDRRV